MTKYICLLLTLSQYISFRDLSFNKLSGTIPRTYADINLTYMYEVSHKFLAHCFGMYF